jgi:type 2 lantibiotic biosynthesis protein LanM
MNNAGALLSSTREDIDHRAEQQSPTSRDQSILAHADAIARTIREASRLTKDGLAEDEAAVWPGQPHHEHWQCGQLQPFRYDLYSGICGIALFLAAWVKVSRQEEYRPLIAAAVRPLCRLTPKQVDDWFAEDSIGAGTGSFSVIYCLLRIATFLGDQELVAVALRMARRVPDQKIERRRPVDVMGGSAGCVLVMCALYGITPEPWIIDRAAQCGDHLLSRRISTPSGFRAWETSPGKCQTGYAHGAAGIIHALCQLFELTGEKKYQNAAAEAITYENSLYYPAEENWPHLLHPKPDGGHACWNSWCNGAPGIGLGRLRSIPCLGEAACLPDVERSLRTAAKSGSLGHIDIPCCGTSGRLELFLETGRSLGSAHCLTLAAQLAESVVRRAARKGQYGLGHTDQCLPLTFHKGLAGIGYQLLRTLQPDVLPSVLTWE